MGALHATARRREQDPLSGLEIESRRDPTDRGSIDSMIDTRAARPPSSFVAAVLSIFWQDSFTHHPHLHLHTPSPATEAYNTAATQVACAVPGAYFSQEPCLRTDSIVLSQPSWRTRGSDGARPWWACGTCYSYQRGASGFSQPACTRYHGSQEGRCGAVR